MNNVYFDSAASTLLDPRVIKAMHDCMTSIQGNPSSLHYYGASAREAIETAREEMAALLHAEPSEFIFTSGATESINLALKGAAKMYQRRGKHIITMKTEHKAVLDACQHLEKEGYRVTYLAPEVDGLLDLDKLANAMSDDTVLVSIMHVNNETGVMQDIAAIAEMTVKRRIIFHVDAAQSAGKLAIDVSQLPIDLISLTAHKVYGPKGVGALYIRKRPRIRLEPLLHGGGHEQGMRSGTLATHQIVGMGTAYRIAAMEMEKDWQKMQFLREQFVSGMQTLPYFKLNIALTNAIPFIVNFRCSGMLADAILQAIPWLAASTASACQGKGTEGSYVLRAMGLSTEEAKSSLRISFGRYSTGSEVEQVVRAFQQL